MAGDVKSRSAGSRRDAQAAATQREIVEAARRLFARDGYQGATVEAIAAEAGVAVQTIYNSIGSKREVLAKLFDVSVAGDDRPVPLSERIGEDIRQEPDPRRIISLLARHFARTHERMLGVHTIVQSAAPADRDVAEYWNRNKERRLWGYTQAAKALRARGGLRPGLTVDAAAAVIWTLSSPEAHGFLTVQGGWSRDRYQRWIEDALAATLLA